MYFLPNIICMIKWRVKWERQVAGMGYDRIELKFCTKQNLEVRSISWIIQVYVHTRIN